MTQKYITLNVDKNLHKRIKLSADLEDKTINEYLSKVLDSILVKVSDIK